jgi:hypothetical protein
VVDGSDADVCVAGTTARYIDIADRIGSRLPLFFAIVIGISYLLLTMVFRSLVIALKAALMNLLSIGAAYGVVVAVFEWGWLLGLTGADKTGPVESFLPMMLFAVLFGLSMDYEVFLVSRIREEYLRTKDRPIGGSWAGIDGERDHGGRDDHDRGLPQLRAERSARGQGVRAGTRRRRVRRCDGGSPAAGARHDGTHRQLELVAARLAGSHAPAHFDRRQP